KPVIYASTPGFKGNNYLGHEWVLQAIIEQYLKPPSKKSKGLVNIWAGTPLHDPFWLGNLRELEKLIAELGLTPNTIFGHGRGIENINKIPEAEFNLLVSPWVGLNSVKLLKEKFETPYLHYATLPVGAFETSKFLRVVGEYAGIDSEKINQIVKKYEDEYYYYIERFADVFLETRVMAKRFTVVSDAQYAVAFTKFLVNDVGLFPAKQYIVDDTPEEYQQQVQQHFHELNYEIQAEVLFSTDGHQIHEEIGNADYYGYPLIIGSSWEKKIAQKTKAHFLAVSWPLNERLVVNSSYVGYGGGLKLLEDIYSVVLTRFN
ncbi:MAG: nitrogenase molybdenum-iron protein, alpha and beta chain, partial [Firmicutes bacterium]|nr:nitrogenase molybdenum-iron protein, alpha and beta chain [Bacillota bacterium]